MREVELLLLQEYCCCYRLGGLFVRAGNDDGGTGSVERGRRKHSLLQIEDKVGPRLVIACVFLFTPGALTAEEVQLVQDWLLLGLHHYLQQGFYPTSFILR
ncbi:Hypp921 [Branchiostoma lanceolatum]|uniref:Hypp921 protein n=1 Tax=Branchiostoma lanceolatum TaxID=7740 RepID=A0A8K0EIP0_BRALA|nr:Hypp921 [Branchiostoma lanceolatum]